MYFSRNGHDYTSVFGPDSNNIGTLTPYIANTFKIDCEKCIIGKFVWVKKSELQIWSLRIPPRNCVLAFLKHDQSIQYG
jgi:hypothetical protein